jgi:hypothetical protein
MQPQNQPCRREPLAVHLPPLVLDRNEAAKALRISIRKLDYLIERGEISPVRIDNRVLVAWAELLRFVESKSVAETNAATTTSVEDKVLELARA